MIKFILLPIILVGCTAPVTDPPAHADVVCLSLDCPKPKPLIPREELRGEIDIYEPMHWHSINQMFIRNVRRKRIEENATSPEDALNNALGDFNWEVIDGNNGST